MAAAAVFCHILDTQQQQQRGAVQPLKLSQPEDIFSILVGTHMKTTVSFRHSDRGKRYMKVPLAGGHQKKTGNAKLLLALDFFSISVCHIRGSGHKKALIRTLVQNFEQECIPWDFQKKSFKSWRSSSFRLSLSQLRSFLLETLIRVASRVEAPLQSRRSEKALLKNPSKIPLKSTFTIETVRSKRPRSLEKKRVLEKFLGFFCFPAFYILIS